MNPTSATTAGDIPRASVPHRALPIPDDRLLVGLLIAAVIGVILQITMGGVVRVTGSGLGCPDWPLCHGRLVPPLDYHAWIEWTHRTIGSVVGIVMVAATARVWTRHRPERWLFWLTTSATVLVIVVGLIGAAVVRTEIHPAIRTLHLGMAEIDLLLVVAALAFATRAFGATLVMKSARTEDRAITRLAWIGAVSILVALLSGSYAVWQGAGGVCSTWPLCGGDSFLPRSELAWIHMTHRLLSGIAAAVVLWAAHRTYRLPGASGALKLASLAALLLVVAQVLVGAANPWTNFDQAARAAHLTLATLLWADTGLVAILKAMRSDEAIALGRVSANA
ncbi:MAG: heme A synthase [Chloroflexi bacterium]|nr:heme A synthase [Chloroflexota bacterium]